jgi:hypothetical protein
MAFVQGVAAAMCSAVLGSAGAAKLGDRAVFGSQIASYQILPLGMSRALGHLLPFLEILAAVSILLWPVLGGIICAGLFLSFGLAIALNLLRGRRELRCGCFGPRAVHLISWWHVFFDLSLAVLAAGAATGRHSPSLLSLQVGFSAFLVGVLINARRSLWAVVFGEPDTEGGTTT